MSLGNLRLMRESDLGLVLGWRNHPDIRFNMYTTHEITYEDHLNWFRAAKENPGKTLLIFERSNAPLGFINFTLTQFFKVADWGFYMSPDAERGAGRLMGKLALKYAYQQLHLHKICGQALATNSKSISFHEALGFREEGCLSKHHFDGEKFNDVICFGLTRSVWESMRGNNDAESIY